jgi:hypothetical protein
VELPIISRIVFYLHSVSEYDPELFGPAIVESSCSTVTNFPGLVNVHGDFDCYHLVLHGIFVAMPKIYARCGDDLSLARYLRIDLLLANCPILVLVR